MCKRFMLCVAAMMLSGVAMAGNLIGPGLQNGSFETAGGVTNTTKIQVWDGTPDIDNWTEWAGVSSANGDSGVEMNAAISTNGVMSAFLQPGNATYNLTPYIAAAGDKFVLRWDHVRQANTIIGGLVYNNGGTITSIPETEVTSTNVALGLGGLYTIPAGSPAIGKAIGVGLREVTGYSDVDNILLTVNVRAGDTNDDGLVNAVDFNAIRDHFRQNVSTRAAGDLNNDGVVNFTDYLEWHANAAGSGAGAGFGVSSVPEPSSLVLAAATSVILASYRRRTDCSVQ